MSTTRITFRATHPPCGNLPPLVTAPITAIATGIDPARFAAGRGSRGRAACGLPPEARVVGHVGRLAAEKNLAFLARAVAQVLRWRPDAWFLVVGSGPAEEEIRTACADVGVVDRLRLAGRLDNQDLADAYAAMDVFAFASISETQGLVLAEAMAAGTLVVAIDAPGTRDVVVDGVNGRLLMEPNETAFATAVLELLNLPTGQRNHCQHEARATAASLAMPVCAERVLQLYEGLLGHGHRGAAQDPSLLAVVLRRLDEEWSLLASKSAALLRM
jgi:1,2-diacylglycerol 3-alpha-glucosyltransferase